MTTKILLSKITKDSPFQTRVPDPEEIQKLAGAIKRDGGIKQPPHVRVQTPPEGVTWKVADYEYEIIFGHNRIAAARLLGWTEIDVEVDKVSDLEAHRMTISENASRADLSQLELAKQMAGARVAFGIDETARMFKMTPATVLTYLHILDLPEEIQQKIHTGEIAKTAVPALIAYDRIMGTEETMKQIKKIGKAADVGSVVLINGMKQDL